MVFRTVATRSPLAPACHVARAYVKPKTQLNVRAMSMRARPSTPRRVVSGLVTVTAIVAGAAFGVYCLDSRAGVHRWLFPPMMELLTDPESGSKISIKLLEHGLAPRDCGKDDEVLHTELFGKTLTNPIGLAAGFDKQGEAIDGLFDLGFGLVEIGSITPEPQPGNPTPRMFRLPLDAAVINRMGFNSEGHEAVRERLHARLHKWVQRVLSAGEGLVSSVGAPAPEPTALAEAQVFANYPVINTSLLDDAHVPRSLKQDRLLSINLGKNKSSREDSVVDYVKGVQALGAYADMLVINVSSPNTPGLRRLQRRSVLEGVLRDVVTARDDVAKQRIDSLPLVVKVAPDLSDAELEDVADAARASKIDGIIVSNTTVSRPAGLLSTQHVHEAGGLSGPPAKPLALHALQVIYKRSEGKIPLIGCGGIMTAEDALEFARAGASAVQLYTALAYRGPGLPRRIKDDLAARLRAEGKTWKDIVGSGLRDVPSYAPDAVNQVGLYPGAQDAFDRSVASVRHEIEQLRESFEGHTSEERRALPFDIDEHDDRFKELLREAHRVTDDVPHFNDASSPQAGVLPQRASSVPEHLLLMAKERGLTQGEVLHEAVHDAAAVPQAPAPALAASHSADVTPMSTDKAAPDHTTLGGLQGHEAKSVPEAYRAPSTAEKRVV